METLPLTPIENIDRLMSVAQASAQELSKAVAIIRSRDKIIEVALEALTELAETGNPTAINAIADMREIHRAQP